MLNRRRISILPSLTSIFQGERLRMRPLQLGLHLLWDQMEDSTLILWDQECRLDLEWWVTLDRLQSGSGQPSPRLLVQRLGRGVEGSSSGCDRFRPMVSGGSSSTDQCQGAACDGVPPLPIPTPCVQFYGGGFCGQFHSFILPPQTGGHSISTS